jgi:glycosyltransferase involved in cell wall biosynthesis
MNTSISIAVCTHNPDRRLLERLLASIKKLDFVDTAERITIIDNNSDPHLLNTEEVQNFLSEQSNAECIREEKPGLTAARCRAIKETSSDVLVFFDDDNEPASNYLTILLDAFNSYPGIGAWGPGIIKVEFLDKTPAEIRKRPDIFQEQSKRFGYVCSPGSWNEYCPFGTGFAVRRSVLSAYASAVESGRLQTTDRIGKSLASAGDVEILWECFKLGMAAGVLPTLRCGHLINSNKASLSYVTRLQFGCSSSYLPALRESFPDITSHGHPKISRVRVASLVLKVFAKRWARPNRRLDFELHCANYLGMSYGQAIISNDPNQNFIRSVAEFLGYL